MTDTTNLRLPCIEGGQAQKHVTHNDALRMLDALVQLAVSDRDLAAPPATPLEGERFIVHAGASGAWAGRDNAIAAWQDGGWQFYAPQAGWIALVIDEQAIVCFDGAAWKSVSAAPTQLQNLALLGIGTTADGVNPLAAKLNNALFTARATAEGGSGDLRYKMSKEAAANTLSLLMQTGYAGRAELGLAGDDDFHVKVSADGVTWREGIVIDRNTGAVTFPNTTIAGGRETLTADRTYFVRTDGSDANDGLSDTAAGAFRSIQRAVDVIARLDLAGFGATVQLADGVYSGGIILKNVAGFAAAGKLVIRGNNATPGNVVVASSAANAFSADSISSVWDIKDVKITTATSGAAISAANGATVRWGNVDFGAAAGAHLIADNAGRLVALSNYAVSGAANIHWQATNGGIVRVPAGLNVTITGAPAFGYWAYLGAVALLTCYGVTFSGSASGVRYIIFSNAVINTAGAGATYLPGDAAGSATSGGQYV